VLILEQNRGTSLHTPCYKAASSLKQSLREQYGLSVPVIYLDIREWFHSDLAYQSYQSDGVIQYRRMEFRQSFFYIAISARCFIIFFLFDSIDLMGVS
jgi:hypothetical protein